MKKTMKKCLILALVVMSVIALAFCVSADNGSDRKYCSRCKEFVTNTVTGATIPAKCETMGYTELLCNQAVRDDNGEIMTDENGNIVRCLTLVGSTDDKNPLGHSEVVSYVAATDAEGEFYKCVTTCSRVVSNTKCTYANTEEYEDEKPVKYYKVQYVNPYVTAETDKSIKYTTLATDWMEEEVYSEYIKEGYMGEKVPTPYRAADKQYGNYKFVGWKISNDEAKTIISVPVTGMKVRDYKAEAVFAGMSNVTHTVTFYSEKGSELLTLTGTNAVSHGGKIDEYTLKQANALAPLKADNIEYKFKFDYWTLFSIIGEFDLTQPIYGDVKLKAHYAETLKQYRLKYFDRHDKALGLSVYDDVNVAGFGTIDRLTPKKAIEIRNNPAAYGIEQNYFDESYDYDFTGNWLIEGRDDAVIDIDHITLPAGTLDYDQTGSYIKVIPQYRKIARVYDLEVFVTYEDDGNWHPEEIDIQVTDADGKGIGVATLTEKDIVPETKGLRTPTYKKVFKVRYSPTYNVAATSKNYKGVKTPIFNIVGNEYDDYKPGGCTILMTREAGKPCTCLCHGILKPVWVGVLNILYNLFKAEFVCCDDMFANIGDALAYGPNKS